MIKVLLGILALAVVTDAPWSIRRTPASLIDDRQSKTLFDADSMVIHYYQKYCGYVCRYDEDLVRFRRIGAQRTIWYSNEIKRGGWCLDGGFEFNDLKEYDLDARGAAAFHWLEKRLQPVDTSRVISCWIYMNDSVLTCSGEDYRTFKERLLRSVRR